MPRRFMFFESFDAAAHGLPDDLRLTYYDTLCDYVFRGEIPTDPIAVAFLATAKPSLDRSIRRSEAGQVGGRASGEARRSKAKQSEANVNDSKANVNDSEAKPNDREAKPNDSEANGLLLRNRSNETETETGTETEGQGPLGALPMEAETETEEETRRFDESERVARELWETSAGRGFDVTPVTPMPYVAGEWYDNMAFIADYKAAHPDSSPSDAALESGKYRNALRRRGVIG